MLVEPLRTTRNGRRYFSAEHKRTVVERCLAPGASVAAVSLEHGFNANLVRRWIRAHQARQASGGSAGALVPVTVSEARQAASERALGRKPPRADRPAGTSTGAIEIQLGAAKLTLRGPVDGGQLRLVLDALARYR